MQKEHVPSMGETMPSAEDALEARFEVHLSSLEARPADPAGRGQPLLVVRLLWAAHAGPGDPLAAGSNI